MQLLARLLPVAVLGQETTGPQKLARKVREIFGAELVADPRFRTTVTNALARIIAKGAKAAVAEV